MWILLHNRETGQDIQRWLGAAPTLARAWFDTRWKRACEVLGYIGLAVEVRGLYILCAIVHAISDGWRECLAKWPLDVDLPPLKE